MAQSGKSMSGLAGGIIRKLVVILALGMFLFAAMNLLGIYLEYKVSTDEYTELEEFTNRWRGMAEGVPEAEVPVDGVMENPIDFEGLREINPDIVGWIEMEAIDVFYPVMQARDNEYYLYRTFKKVNNKAGSLFVDYRNRPDFEDKNTIIYGHNMKNGSMFGQLKEFLERPAQAEAPAEDLETDTAAPSGEDEQLCAYDRSPYFWIYTPEYIYQYEIYSVAEVDEHSKDYQREFETEEAYQKFIDRTVGQSRYETGVAVSVTDTVVTLSTCTAAHEERLIVQGKRIKTYKAVPCADGYGTPEN